MQYQFPHTIESKYGEKITFLRMEGERLILEGICKPDTGPAMHVHLRQDESFTVVSGKIAYQILGEAPCFGGPGDTITFKRGQPHRFWNPGKEDLHIKGWIDPVENIVFFLSTLYDAMNRGKNHQPEAFDGAYLACRYKNEYDLPEMPGFVKHVMMPTLYFIGRVMGKYRKYIQAPSPY